MVDFNRNVYCLLGLPFDAVTLSEAVDRVRRAAFSRQRCFLSTPNLSFLIGCLADRGFRDSIINSDLSVADGMPLVWMARLLGISIRERVAGSEVFEALRSDSARPLSVYFLAGRSACPSVPVSVSMPTRRACGARASSVPDSVLSRR